jgi:hypothetical protein
MPYFKRSVSRLHNQYVSDLESIVVLSCDIDIAQLWTNLRTSFVASGGQHMPQYPLVPYGLPWGSAVGCAMLFSAFSSVPCT